MEKRTADTPNLKRTPERKLPIPPPMQPKQLVIPIMVAMALVLAPKDSWEPKKIGTELTRITNAPPKVNPIENNTVRL